MMSLCNRVVKSGVNFAIFFAKSRAISTSSSSSFCNRFNYRHISQLVRPNNKQVRGMEAGGIPSKQAEVITADVAHTFVSTSKMQKEHRLFMLQRETEKLRVDIEKMCSELSYEIRSKRMLTSKAIQASKYDVIKCYVGTLVSTCLVGIAVIHKKINSTVADGE